MVRQEKVQCRTCGASANRDDWNTWIAAEIHLCKIYTQCVDITCNLKTERLHHARAPVSRIQPGLTPKLVFGTFLEVVGTTPSISPTASKFTITGRDAAAGAVKPQGRRMCQGRRMRCEASHPRVMRHAIAVL